MRRWIGWFRSRRAQRGFGTNVANVGSVIFWAVLFTGSLGIIQVVRFDAILNAAVHTALASEAQNGCWTSATTQAVVSTMTGAGLNPSSVHVAGATTATTPYGHPVEVSLNTYANVGMLGLTFTVPLRASATGTSFYVPAAVGAVNPACSAPEGVL